MRDIEILRLTSPNTSITDGINHLLKQLASSPISFSSEDLQRIIEDKNSTIFILRQQTQVVGMLTLCTYLSPIGRKVWIEDVVVDSTMRGKGYGKLLVDHAIKHARTLSPCTLMLTSRPSRIAANELYRASGFEQKITNVYKMSL